MPRGIHTRDTAWRELDIEHEAVSGLINALTDEQMTRPDTIEYGLYAGQELSFKDLLAHLICYEELTLAAYADWQAGRQHPCIEGFRTGRDDVRVHFEGIAVRRPHSLEQVLSDWERISTALVTTIHGMSDAEWVSPPPFDYPYSLDVSGLFELILCMPPRPPYRHLPVHIPDTDAYLRRLRNA